MIKFISIDNSNITPLNYISENMSKFALPGEKINGLTSETGGTDKDAIIFFKLQKTIWAKGTFYTCTPAIEQVISGYSTTNVSGALTNTDTILLALKKLEVKVDSTNQKIKVGNTTFGNNDEINLVAGNNVTITPDTTVEGAPKITIAATDTTYESKSAASGGADLSLVTTGEKYTWNSKLDALTNPVTRSGNDALTANKIILGNGDNAVIPSSYEITTATVNSSSNDTTVPTSKAVWNAINALPEPMVFKGSLGTGGTITTLPSASSSNEGFTYKVIADGTYASTPAKVGDTFICAKTGDNTYSWVLIPSGDEPSGTVTSVGITLGTGISVSGGPITSSGSITVGLADNYGDSKNPYAAKEANKVLAGPTSGTAAAPAFRSLVAADIPDLSSTYEPKFSDGSATIASVNNGVVTLKAGISLSGGAIGNNSSADIALVKVATTGNYNDLSNKPTIGTGAFKIYAGSTEVGGTSANATGDTSVTFAGLGGISVQKASGSTVNISLDWEELS